ncbi:MAG: hypothetical protein ACI9KE_000244 [Polyangiales bacterium]|jgi:hypothetical protein
MTSHLDSRIDPGKLSKELDAMTSAARNRWVLGLGRRQQRRLFAAVEGHSALNFDFLVPAERGVMSEVVHEGRNTLPAFRRFAKVFCRPEGRDELWGYNRTNTLTETVVGPGYFVTRTHGDGELIVDYLVTPPDSPPGWPKIVPNETRLSRFVYAGTQDILRRVSADVSIGRAQKKGRWLPAWFVLVRQQP